MGWRITLEWSSRKTHKMTVLESATERDRNREKEKTDREYLFKGRKWIYVFCVMGSSLSSKSGQTTHPYSPDKAD